MIFVGSPLPAFTGRLALKLPGEAGKGIKTLMSWGRVGYPRVFKGKNFNGKEEGRFRKDAHFAI
jgi:hypothetical protein